MAPTENLATGHFPLPSGMLEIDTVRGGDDLCLRLSGEMDLAFVDRVEEAIRVAEKSAARAIVVDLSDLEFMDSVGLAMLLQAHTRTRLDGQTLSFVPSSHDAVRQLVAVTGTSKIFD
jgi:anti-sigma B factor antagonist